MNMKNPYQLTGWLMLGILALFALKSGYMEGVDKYIYYLRLKYIPATGFQYEDYLQYLPIIVLLGMKSMGVRSRDTWKQILVFMTFSIVLMTIIVFPIKEAVHVLRPDGTDFLSFPSGHTAMAFTAAGLLYKEYGFRSPWIGVAAYLPAVITGIARQLHDRHWTSDVIAGVIIGVLVVESGYFLAGLIFRKKLLIL